MLIRSRNFRFEEMQHIGQLGGGGGYGVIQ